MVWASHEHPPASHIRICLRGLCGLQPRGPSRSPARDLPLLRGNGKNHRCSRRCAPLRAGRSSIGSATTTSFSSTPAAGICCAWRWTSSTGCPQRRGEYRHGRFGRRRQMDRTGRVARLELAARLHVAVAARLRARSGLERPGGDRFVCRVLDVKTRKLRTLPCAIGSLSPDGKGPSAKTLAAFGISVPATATPAFRTHTPGSRRQPSSGCGGWTWRPATRSSSSVADLVRIPYPGQSPDDRHYVNHLSWSPDGKRFLMFNRWRAVASPHAFSRWRRRQRSAVAFRRRVALDVAGS